MIQVPKHLKRGLIALVALVLVGGGLAACGSEAVAPAQCGFVIGDGQYGHDRDVHKIINPGQTVDVSDSEVVQYVPCGARNYLITPIEKINDQPFGDRHVPSIVQLKGTNGQPGIKVKVWSDMFWTLNQNPEAMKVFQSFCYKYTCYTTNAEQAGDANFSTPGWNGMLAENVGQVTDRAAGTIASSFGPEILNNRSQWPAFADAVSAEFVKQFHANSGSDKDLICGSGNSVWIDPNKVGTEGNFKCTPTRFVITGMEPEDPEVARIMGDQAKADAQKQLNASEFEAAKARYGDQASFWLGLQDAIAKCKAGSGAATCVVQMGSGSAPVSVTPTK